MRFDETVERLRRRLRDETGVVLVVALGVMLVLGLIAASVLVSAVASNNNSYRDRTGKQALAASLTGLRTALYRLNTSIPADSDCPPSATGGTVTPDSDGVCGPYSSTDPAGAQPTPRARFTYWLTPVLARAGGSGATDFCSGNSLAPPGLPAAVIRERCITSQGQALSPDGSTVISTRRVQARASATGQLFIIPGIWGTDSVKVGSGQSTANIIGAIGSNGMGLDQSPGFYDIDLNARNWGDSVNPLVFGGKSYYMGGDVYYGRAAGRLPTASLIYTATTITDPTTFPPTTTTCLSCPVGTSANKSPSAALSSLIVPDANNNHPRDLGKRLPLDPVGPIFRSPPAPVKPQAAASTDAAPIYGGDGNPSARLSNACQDVASPTAPSPFAPCDTARENDNVGGISASAGCQLPVYNAGSGTPPDTRTLTLRPTAAGQTCTVTLQNGVYNFCNIDFSSDSKIVPADTSAKAEVYIFIDSNARTLLPGIAGGATGQRACTSGISGDGNVTTPPGAGSVTSFMDTATTSLAGQLYFWGAGDSAQSGNGTTTKVSHNVVIPPGWHFKGLVFAPNSNVDLKPNTTLQGGLAARTVEIENGATYAWDVGVDLVDVTAGRRTYYRVQYKTCDPQIPVVAGAPRPMDAC